MEKIKQKTYKQNIFLNEPKRKIKTMLSRTCINVGWFNKEISFPFWERNSIKFGMFGPFGFVHKTEKNFSTM